MPWHNLFGMTPKKPIKMPTKVAKKMATMVKTMVSSQATHQGRPVSFQQTDK
jgi:hypothetical protein